MTDVVAALAELRGAISWPDGDPDLTGHAVARIGARPSRRRWPTMLIASVVAVGVAVPAAAHLLSIGGVRITATGSLPADIETELDLGRPAAVRDDAARPPALGAPAGAFEGAPPGAYTEVWPGPVLITRFPGVVGEHVIDKRVVGEGTVVRTAVDGDPAWWIGDHHGFLYVDAEGRTREDTLRLAGQALLWSRDGITYRLEAPDLTLPDAVALAESMH